MKNITGLPGLSSIYAYTDGETLSTTLNQTNQRNLGYIFCLRQHSSHSQNNRFKVTLRWTGSRIKQDNKQLGEATGLCYTLDCSEDLKFHRRKINQLASKHTMSCILGKHPHHSRKIYNTREELLLHVFSCVWIFLCRHSTVCVSVDVSRSDVFTFGFDLLWLIYCSDFTELASGDFARNIRDAHIKLSFQYQKRFHVSLFLPHCCLLSFGFIVGFIPVR